MTPAREPSERQAEGPHSAEYQGSKTFDDLLLSDWARDAETRNARLKDLAKVGKTLLASMGAGAERLSASAVSPSAGLFANWRRGQCLEMALRVWDAALPASIESIQVELRRTTRPPWTLAALIAPGDLSFWFGELDRRLREAWSAAELLENEPSPQAHAAWLYELNRIGPVALVLSGFASPNGTKGVDDPWMLPNVALFVCETVLRAYSTGWPRADQESAGFALPVFATEDETKRDRGRSNTGTPTTLFRRAATVLLVCVGLYGAKLGFDEYRLWSLQRQDPCVPDERIVKRVIENDVALRSVYHQMRADHDRLLQRHLDYVSRTGTESPTVDGEMNALRERHSTQWRRKCEARLASATR